jgi:formylglycine-generating enzyme required for sulfatase activity
MDSHLINNGVDETPPSRPSQNGDSSAATGHKPHDLFIDLEGTNVGFKHWHPVSVVEKGGELCGQSDMGGVWEWTSTVLEKTEGFEPMELYPGYTGMSSPDGHETWSSTGPRSYLHGHQTPVDQFEHDHRADLT